MINAAHISESIASRHGKRPQTADRLLDAAEELFAEQGYAATSLRDIAKVVKISQPALYKHFESKDALYQQVLQRALQPLADEMEDTARRPVEEASFRTLGGRLTDVLTRHPNVSMLLIRSLLSPPSDRDEIGMEWVNRLADYGRRITHAVEKEPDGRNMALNIVATFNMMFGYFWAAQLVRGLSGSDPLSPDMIARQKALLTRFDTMLGSGKPITPP